VPQAEGLLPWLSKIETLPRELQNSHVRGADGSQGVGTPHT
jgi:hypothetical protein